jgi:hypothetical protein
LGPYRLFFFADDRHEPPHVHVERDDCRAKFWLDPVRFDNSYGFRPVELRGIHALIEEHATQLRKAWHEFFGN